MKKGGERRMWKAIEEADDGNVQRKSDEGEWAAGDAFRRISAVRIEVMREGKKKVCCECANVLPQCFELRWWCVARRRKRGGTYCVVLTSGAER